MKTINKKTIAAVLTASMVFAGGNVIASTNTSPNKVLLAEAGEPAQTGQESDQGGEANTAPPAAEDMSTLRLSLEDALKLVETGNSTWKLTKDKIAIYERQYEQALALHNANYDETDEDSAKRKWLNHKKALWTLENAKHDQEEQLEDLKVQITNQYQNILAAQQQVKTLNAQLNNVDTLIDQVKLQVDLGMGIQSQLSAMNAQKSSLEAGLKAVQNSINSSMIALKRDLGINVDRNVVLTSDLTSYSKFDDSKLKDRIAKTIENDYDKKRYGEDIELTEIEYKIAFRYSNMTAADQFQISIEDKKATLEALPVTKEVSLRTAYNNLKSLENTIHAAQLTVEADQIEMDILQKKIEVGTASPIEMIEPQNKLLNDQYTLLQNINSYMTAAASFENSLDQ
ncbi:hypothetical protein HMPREF0322_05161 [Desulfitobacterium hafniense DP7]|uniref:Outer membrane efflux protein n=1 Tax=Desulfitobacterium hafniense DP7 TaxID=537010 RepID=G9XVX8_DESHA|nr:TolC family protein [Desulfitobacterium hafniense]EHL04241.1 hypothetical protein HMPREF0322_05161 [Desulfitobacterium hafniense DP7]